MAARLGRLIPVALAAATLCVPAGHAGLLSGSCPGGGSQVFAPWGDSAYYNPAQNGGFESGSTGWSLSGASVVSGNEPFLGSGSHSLSLPSGSSALSPVICLGPDQLYVRMFGSDGGGTDRGLHVRVYWYGLLNTVLGSTDYDTYAGGGGWAPTGKLSSSGGFQVPLVPLLGSTSARVQVTPFGSGSNWRIDDLYVDPCIGRIG